MSRATKLAPLYNTPDSGSPYLLGRRLGRLAAEMNQHLAAQQEDREDEPLPAYPRSRSRNPLHRVTCRNLTGRQAVTQSAAPQPPTFPHVGSGPRGPTVSSTEYLSARGSRTSVPGHLKPAVPPPGRWNSGTQTSRSLRPPLTDYARSLFSSLRDATSGEAANTTTGSQSWAEP